MKNVKTNRDPLLAAAGVALLGGNSIRQMLVFLTQKPIFSSISYMRVLFEYMILLELTLKYLGGMIQSIGREIAGYLTDQKARVF